MVLADHQGSTGEGNEMSVRTGLRASRMPAVTLAAFLAVAALAGATRAADNTATGNIAGVAGSLGNSNVFTINSSTLALAKTAFLVNGTPLTSGTTLARGTLARFMVYVDNSTGAAADSVNVQDALAAAFAYQPGTIKVDSSQATGSTTAAIYAAVNATTPLSDAVSGSDVAGINGSTISAGGAAGNAVVTIPAGRVWAMLFTVRVQ